MNIYTKKSSNKEKNYNDLIKKGFIKFINYPDIILFLPVCFILFIILMPISSMAHGFAGKRFFPSTLSVEDPFVSDELSFLFGYLDEGEEKAYEFPVEYSKRITQNFGIGIDDSFLITDPDSGSTESGFGNLGLGAKYQFLTNGPHETILSLGVDAEIGNTGDSSVGADDFTTVVPSLYFGKGFGDLPDSLMYLRPFAVTGVIGPAFTIDSDEPDRFEYGFTIQYSFQYLESFVKDIGIPKPLDKTILVLEFPFETALNQGAGGETEGFINPGIIWIGNKIQLGLEAQIPVNHNSGQGVGVLALIHFFIDDIFPNSIGSSVFK